jgi:hypothetical protein
MNIASIERLEDRRLMSVSLSGATSLGNLNGRQTFADSLNATSNAQDVRKFTMLLAGTFGASMTGLSANADVELIRDTNNNSIVDSGEVLASAAHTGRPPKRSQTRRWRRVRITCAPSCLRPARRPTTCR